MNRRCVTAILLTLTSELLATQTKAQVANDSCLSAREMEMEIFNGPQCYMYNGAFGGLLLQDSTFGAQITLPYPYNPGSCYGYSGLFGGIAPDLWYRFIVLGSSNLEAEVVAVDSIKLSWWQGECGSLADRNCYLIAPGDTMGVPPVYLRSVPWDTLYLQVTPASTSMNARFELCYTGAPQFDGPVFYGTYGPTHVICLMHAIDVG